MAPRASSHEIYRPAFTTPRLSDHFDLQSGEGVGLAVLASTHQTSFTSQGFKQTKILFPARKNENPKRGNIRIYGFVGDTD